MNLNSQFPVLALSQLVSSVFLVHLLRLLYVSSTPKVEEPLLTSYSESFLIKQTRKRSVEYSPAEVSSADDFRSQSERLSRGASLKRRGGRNDRVRLERQVDEAVERFDRRLAALYAKRLAVEKCVLTEELKMRLLDRKLSDMEDLEAEEKRLK